MESCNGCGKKIGANEAFAYDGKCYACNEKVDTTAEAVVDERAIAEEFGEPAAIEEDTDILELDDVEDDDDSGYF